MKTIILFRHGKSRWNFGVKDYDRDLENIGIERTKKSAKELSHIFGNKVDAWYSSPALRAKHTAQITHKYFTNPSKIQFFEELYTFSFFDLLKFIKKIDNQVQTILIFGHNEAFTEFANRMGNQYIENVPTSGVVAIEFNTGNWQLIEKGITKIILKPKNL
ncbi:MAG: SixA phosphatase family protein [Moheibacter sp.]